ncbi:MAG: ABC transporter permease [Emergencia sp.]
MWRGFLSLLKKDFKLMLSSKFLLLALGSLILYSCYINLVYVSLDQDIYPVYLYDPFHVQQEVSADIVKVDSLEELKARSEDGYAIGIDVSNGTPEITMTSSGLQRTDNYRAAYALSLLSPSNQTVPEMVGKDNKEMKSRREITCEFLFFELAAVGFLGLASMLFKEKQMGVVRIHGVLPISKTAFILSKLGLFLLSDLVFAILLTVINLGFAEGLLVLPYVLVQAVILSLIMALVGFFCAIRLPDFKQFSLLYLVLAVFITTPVFLVGQTGITWNWIKYHPMYHLFMTMKNAYSGISSANGVYYMICGITIILLFLLVRKALIREMAKEG